MKVIFRFGLVAEKYLEKIWGLWPKMRSIIRDAIPNPGIQLTDFLHLWVHPRFGNKNVSEPYLQKCHNYAKLMLLDLMELSKDQWTHQHHLCGYGEEFGLAGDIVRDPIAEVLYSTCSSLDWEKVSDESSAKADILANELMAQGARQASATLTRLDNEARLANIYSMLGATYVCQQIARKTDDPAPWIEELSHCNANAQLVEPFFARIVAEDTAHQDKWICVALEHANLRGIGIQMALTKSAVGSLTWTKAYPLLGEYSNWIGRLVVRNEFAEDALRSLLEHPDEAVAVAVATHLWRPDGIPPIPPRLFRLWRDVVVRCVDEHHSLIQIAKSHPDIGYDWIAARLKIHSDGGAPKGFDYRAHSYLPNIVGTLGREQKLSLINLLPPSSHCNELVELLVSGDTTLYEDLVGRKELGHLRFVPLELDLALPSEWEARALIAIKKGISTEQIFWASQAGGGGWEGRRSSMYESKRKLYDQLRSHENPQLQEIGILGVAHFERLWHLELVKEKRAIVRGEID
jgi:hypothetical protein